MSSSQSISFVTPFYNQKKGDHFCFAIFGNTFTIWCSLDPRTVKQEAIFLTIGYGGGGGEDGVFSILDLRRSNIKAFYGQTSMPLKCKSREKQIA